ncbi:NAD-dependent epimerase/dehydratase family protein [Nannocystis bainbridge]|uniref:NAD-dependent epimerase/dehydratase family protein n=1 Tax=Nannocystis bainbridge TaxID=2995303 RepID=A0ABT5E0B0_9BACT|nr:NAD-dependent epimerase/dehydratase family protein [Nannocystis bainbridge]MDC0719321.1 NAD-dependent epimerase/dehydratase family protein [Nannocystis bainbridge]
MPTGASPIARPIAVVGAGFLGAPVAAALADPAGVGGSPVLATSRSGTWPNGHVPEGIQVRPLDVAALAPADIAATLAGARALVVCYAPGKQQDRRELYVEGTRRLLAAAVMLRPTRLVYVSSTSALPDRDAWLDDDCADWPDEPRGRVQREAEELVRDTCTRHDLPWTILRLAGLYGPGRELFRLYRGAGEDAVLPGDGMQPTNLVHRDDAVQAVLAALALEPEQRGVVNVVDDDHTPRREIFARLAALAGRPPPRWERPPGPAAVGKRVANARLKTLLRVTLLHPSHTPENP